MKKLLLTVALTSLIGAATFLPTQGQGITAPRTASPSATVSQTIGISTVDISYSRPSVRDREVWGALVPFGYNVQPFGAQNPAPWRAGANENTTISFSHAAKIDGKAVPAGTYGLFFVINKDNSGEIILSRDYESWGSFWYDPQRDLLRAGIKLRDIPHTEMLTYEFINLTKNTGELVLNWEKKQFPVKIEFAVDDIVLSNAANELKNTVGFSWQGYNSAANYALQNKTQLEQGLKWADQAIAINSNFTSLNTKSGLLLAMGKEAEADKIIEGAIGSATEVELNAYGYQLINQKKFDKAIEMFTLNTKRHPESANVWDSLGEAYALKGDQKNAIKNFKKCLSMNPPANIRANSEKYLKQFNAL